MSVRTFAVSLIAFVFLGAGHGYAKPANTDTIELTSSQATTLENVACSGPYGVGAASVLASQSRSNGRISAYIRCKSHAKYEHSPLFGRATCHIEGEQWLCNSFFLGIELYILGDQRDVVLGNITPKEGSEIVSYLESLPEYHGRSITPERIRSIIRIDRNDDGIYQVLTSHEPTLLFVIRTCSQSECRHEVKAIEMIDY